MYSTYSLTRALAVGFFSVIFFLPLAAHAATNLIQNGTLEAATVSSTTPDFWHVGGFGTSTAVFTYPVAGPAGASDKAVNINVTSYSDGDRKWFSDSAVVQSGGVYTFSDSYKSNVPTFIVAQFTLADNSVSFVQLAALPSSGNMWTTSTSQFTPPLNVSSVIIFHLIKSVGELSTDNYSLTQTIAPQDNIFPSGMVSLTFDDGWSSQYDNAFPLLQSNNMKGTFYIISNPTKDADAASSYDFFKDPVNETDLKFASTTHQATWSQLYPDPNNSQYHFSDTYTSSAPNTIVVTYTKLGGVVGSTTIGTFAAGTNLSASAPFLLPPLASSTPITITQSSTGTLTVKNPSMTEENQYLTSQQVLNLQAGGQEIGDHTRDHCNLVQLDLDPNSALSTVGCPDGPLSASVTATQEISDSLTYLSGIGVSQLLSIAYPYGAYNNNVETLVHNLNLTSGRSVDVGFNTKNTDKYALKIEGVVASTTPTQVQGWVDTAVANKLWLILVFHQIDESSAGIETEATTKDVFSQIVSYLHTKNVPVKTVTQGVALMNANSIPSTPPPVITLTGPASTTITVGAAYVEQGATVSDSIDGNTDQVIIGGFVNTAAIGTYHVTYDAVDTSGIHALQVIRTVNVVATAPAQDTIAPVIILTGLASTTLTVGDTYVEQGATATDNVDSNVVVIINSTAVNTAVAGSYVVTYDATDAAGNHATQVIRTVTVNAPVTPPPTGGGGGGGIGGGSPITMPIPSAGSGGGGGSIGGGIVLGTSTSATTTPNTGSTVSTTTPTTTPQILAAYKFTKSLKIGSRGADVIALQKILISLGLLKLQAPTGYYGILTFTAVKAFQALYHISQVGVIGPITRTALNALASGNLSVL